MRREKAMETNSNKAMRDALEYASRVLAKWRQVSPFSAWNEYGEAIDRCNAARREPQRNCDVGTLTEQQKRFHDFCEKMQHTDKACCGGCPIVHLRMKGVINNSCELAWAQMPYDEDESEVK